MPFSEQLYCLPSGVFSSVVVDRTSLFRLVVLQVMQSLGKKSFIFLLKPQVSDNRSTGGHRDPIGKYVSRCIKRNHDNKI